MHGATGVWAHSRGECRLSTSSPALCVLYLDGYGHGATRVPIYTDVGSVSERTYPVSSGGPWGGPVDRVDVSLLWGKQELFVFDGHLLQLYSCVLV